MSKRRPDHCGRIEFLVNKHTTLRIHRRNADSLAAILRRFVLLVTMVTVLQVVLSDFHVNNLAFGSCIVEAFAPTSTKARIRGYRMFSRGKRKELNLFSTETGQSPAYQQLRIAFVTGNAMKVSTLSEFSDPEGELCQWREI
jgi:hypothetical protein